MTLAAIKDDDMKWKATLLLAAGLWAATSHSVQAQNQTLYLSNEEVIDTEIRAESTDPLINDGLGGNQGHFIIAPRVAARRHPKLIVMLGGSFSNTNSYTGLARRMARQGYAVIVLNYPNNQIIGNVCNNDDACFRETRGEVVFGRNFFYASGVGGYIAPPMGPLQPNQSTAGNVDAANSVINRLIRILDFLRYQPPVSAANATFNNPETIPSPAYWAQFLVDSPGSPYLVTPDAGETANRRVYPDWSRIVLAGHAQGASHAAFISILIPVFRTVLLSSPNDHDETPPMPLPAGLIDDPCCTASWIYAPSATPLVRYWGIRSAEEGNFGNFNVWNWENLGGPGGGGVGGGTPSITPAMSKESFVDDGSGVRREQANPAGGLHRLRIAPTSGFAATNHSDAAVYINNGNRNDPPIAASWDYVFTGGFSDPLLPPAPPP